MAKRLLVCAATAGELHTFLRDDEIRSLPVLEAQPWFELGTFAVTVTGVGIPCTLLRLPRLLELWKPDLVLNIGIAGAYPNSGVAIGDVAIVRSETFGDIGFELPEDPGFRHVSAAPFGGFYEKIPLAMAAEFRYKVEKTPCASRTTEHVKAAPSPSPYGRPGEGWGEVALSEQYSVHETDGCTVNCCTGTMRTGQLRERLFGAGIESMEGAAVALACQAAGVAACEVRAVSNYAANREMLPQNIKLALEHLRDYLHACRNREGI